ncbi:MAG TPA: hypothetical protein VFZ09_18160 [Archangium sp.]|uniref:hypothetical protein n=1 Tax=Archangium sp. TaxID=1872627 RepID=UPI002E37123C|nr:hypothetical protein [Archangium sp.]HEX5748170.1 hypothetical protein [Archangium sp.]
MNRLLPLRSLLSLLLSALLLAACATASPAVRERERAEQGATVSPPGPQLLAP